MGLGGCQGMLLAHCEGGDHPQQKLGFAGSLLGEKAQRRQPEKVLFSELESPEVRQSDLLKIEKCCYTYQ